MVEGLLSTGPSPSSLVCTCIQYTRGCSTKKSCSKKEGERVGKLGFFFLTWRGQGGVDGYYDFELQVLKGGPEKHNSFEQCSVKKPIKWIKKHSSVATYYCGEGWINYPTLYR